MYVVVGFALGLGLSYVVFPFPTPGPQDDKGIERFVITALVMAAAFVAGKVVAASKSNGQGLRRLDGAVRPSVDESTTKASSLTPADQLRELARLRDEGVLSEDEFVATKAELLKRM